MNDFDALLARVVDQARAARIPAARNIDPHVRVNRRAVTRFGCCAKLCGVGPKVAEIGRAHV